MIVRLARMQTRVFWVDWKILHKLVWPASLQNDSECGPEFRMVFSELWFTNRGQAERRFIPGEIAYGDKESPILFVNGRHRSCVLGRFLTSIPVAVDSELRRRKFFSSCIVRRFENDENLDLPDLPILSPSVLTKCRTFQYPNP